MPINPIRQGLLLHDLYDAERIALSRERGTEVSSERPRNGSADAHPHTRGSVDLRVDLETSAQGPVRKQDCDPTVWLNRIYRLCDQEKTSPAIELVFDMLDDLLFAGNLERCDEILRIADVSRLLGPVALSFLTITMPARAELKERVNFFQKARDRLLQLRSKDKVDALLTRLG